MAEQRKLNFQGLKTMLFIIALLWIILLLSTVFESITSLGIRPRSVSGIIGIFTSPLIHRDMAHLIANSTGLFFLGLIFLGLEQSRAGFIIIPIYLFSGLGTWIIGRPDSNHIGASGVVYGLMGYLLTIGFFRKNVWTILLSILIFVLYGGTLWGIVPIINGVHVSWEGHLCGFLAGILTAWSESKMKR